MLEFSLEFNFGALGMSFMSLSGVLCIRPKLQSLEHIPKVPVATDPILSKKHERIP